MRIRFSSIFLLATALCPLVPSGAVAQVAAGCFKLPATDCSPKVDIPLNTANTYDALYKAYSELAWQDFLALSLPVAPADTDGKFTAKPDASRALSSYDPKHAASYKTVWGTFTSADDLFQTGGTEPKEYGSLPALPRACNNKLTEDQQKLPVLANIAKSGIQDEYVQANRMGPVIDQNGNYLRYGIGFNQVMHDYVVKNNLFSAKGQNEFAKTSPRVMWSSGAISNNTVGSIFVKSSWKIIAGVDNRAEFYTMDALIYTPEHGTFGEEPTIEAAQCEVKTVGLVGLHIVHRTPSTPQWVWAPFEHINNAPYYDEINTDEKAQAFKAKNLSYSLFNPGLCTKAAGSADCKINQVPDHPWNPLVIHKEKATQVVRMVRPGKIAADVNNVIHEKLKSANAPWKNYFLVDVQFPTVLRPRDKNTGVAAENPAYPDGVPTPSFLANSTMETYIQGLPAERTTATTQGAAEKNTIVGVPRVTSSCISCHYDATSAAGTNLNFVFSPSRVKK